MAASSSSSRTHKDFVATRENQNENNGEGDHEGDWLQLGLRLGSGVVLGGQPSCPSAIPLPPSQVQQEDQGQPYSGLELGLGLGFDNQYSRSPVRRDQLGVVALPDLHDLRGSGGGHYEMVPASSSSSLSRSLSLLTSVPVSVSSWAPLHAPADDSRNHHDHHRGRPQAGLWFTLLRSSIDRDGEGLPQLPEAYIRVKDENVTVLTVKNYLVRKLGLCDESEVDISCMGQKLLQSQTLKHVRDAIWLPGLLVHDSFNSRSPPLNNGSSSHDHHMIFVNHLIMSLHYGRPCY